MNYAFARKENLKKQKKNKKRKACQGEKFVINLHYQEKNKKVKKKRKKERESLNWKGRRSESEMEERREEGEQDEKRGVKLEEDDGRQEKYVFTSWKTIFLIKWCENENKERFFRVNCRVGGTWASSLMEAILFANWQLLRADVTVFYEARIWKKLYIMKLISLCFETSTLFPAHTSPLFPPTNLPEQTISAFYLPSSFIAVKWGLVFAMRILGEKEKKIGKREPRKFGGHVSKAAALYTICQFFFDYCPCYLRLYFYRFTGLFLFFFPRNLFRPC